MTITLDIRPEVKDELARQAAAHGMTVDGYAAGLLEQAAHVPGKPQPNHRPAGRKSLAQLFADSPFHGLELAFEREPDLGRDLPL